MGPTIIRVEELSHALHVNLRTGTVMSLLNTATGLVFAAFLAPKVVEGMIKNEAGRVGGLADPPSRKKTEALLAEVRRHGLARVAGTPIPGINAVSAPVFDHAGNIALAITAMGPSGVFDPDYETDRQSGGRNREQDLPAARIQSLERSPIRFESLGSKGVLTFVVGEDLGDWLLSGSGVMGSWPGSEPSARGKISACWF